MYFTFVMFLVVSGKLIAEEAVEFFAVKRPVEPEQIIDIDPAYEEPIKEDD